MSNVIMDAICTETLRQMDCYVDREIDTTAGAAIRAHIEACPACRQEFELRRSLRSRLKKAVTASPASPFLHTKVLAQVRAAADGRTPRFGLRRQFAAIAAMLIISFALGTVSYQLGHLRFTTGAQESYIASISARVAKLMSVGLADHVHCTVFRKFTKSDIPTSERMAADLGPDYKGLLEVVRPHVPTGYEMVQGHRCRYHGRQFIHLAMRSGSHLISVVITKKQSGETFRNSNLFPALSDAGLPIYHDAVQRFDISGFETIGHLVYLVSDAPGKENSQLMLALAPDLGQYLSYLES